METAERRVNIEDDLDTIETVLYVLQKCQEELLEEQIQGANNRTYGKKILLDRY